VHTADVHAAAAQGTQGAGASLPHLDQIQRSFGRHDVSGVKAHTGDRAAAASAQLGARAYAHGDSVAFAGDPDLHTAAHEAAHVVQQRGGVQLKGGIDGGASDPYEQHADAVADAVVAGNSAEGLLDQHVRGGTAGGAHVQRKSLPESAVDGETKYTFKSTHSDEINIAGVPAKLSESFEYSVKDKGSLTASDDWGAKGAALSTQRLLEDSGKGLEAKIKGSLVKGSFDLLTAGQLPDPLSELPLTVRAEITGLDAGLSFKKLDFKLMSAAVVLEGNFTAWMPKEVQAHFEAKGSVRLEFQLAPELAHKLIELSKASDDVKRSLEVEAKLSSTESKLAKLKNAERAGLPAAPGEIRELETELSELRAIRGPAAKLRKKALQTIEKIGEELEERAGGRLLKKVAGKALGFVFHKFLPIYNTISTIEDVYEAGKFLSGLNWDDIGKKIVDGGDGGSSLEDGTHHEGPEGVGGSGDDGELPDAEALQADLDRRTHVTLNPAAKSIVDSLEAKGSNNRPGAQPLSAEDQATINSVVPDDLTLDEIMQVSADLNAPGSTPQNTVEAVIAAVQRIRPFGEKRSLAPSKQDGADPDVEAKPAKKGPKPSAKHKPKPKRGGAASPIIDLIPTLARAIAVNPETGKATPPSGVNVQGVVCAIVSVTTAPVTLGNESGYLVVQVHVQVMSVPDGKHLTFPNGTAVEQGIEQTVVYDTGADLTVRASD